MPSRPWTDFWKAECDKESPSCGAEKEAVQEVTLSIDVGPGGLSFEDGMSHNVFAPFRVGLMSTLA